jgi:hypothetical protein
MSTYTIAREHVERAVEAGKRAGIAEEDALHALLVAVVERYKVACGSEKAGAALDFQIRNLSDDEDYAFMRP